MAKHDDDIRAHHDEVVAGTSDCGCKVTDSFEHGGKAFTAVKFAPECVDPQVGIDALLGKEGA
jgi:hypothetical protein